ncbi:MAG: peptidoglycan-binding domain-containing protein, partial [Pseudomonadota bacterium]
WPRGDRGLSFTEKKEMQRLLSRRGFPVGKVDGIIGPNTIQAVREYQASIGLEPDGYASLDVLKRLR